MFQIYTIYILLKNEQKVDEKCCKIKILTRDGKGKDLLYNVQQPDYQPEC